MSRHRLAWLPAAALLAACDHGTVNLSVADAPVDGAERVVVQFDRVTLERDDGETETFELGPRAIDLLALTQGDAQLLISERVDAGRYRAVILGITASGSGGDSLIDFGDTESALRLDPTDEDLLRIATSFEVERGETRDLVVDFDLRKSVRTPADPATEPYELLPALRLHDEAEVGALFGNVSASLVSSGCAPAVYVYSGHGVTPGQEGGTTPPYASGIVRPGATAAFTYSVEWLPAGEYTAAFTCDADADEADSGADAVAFGDDYDVTIDEELATRRDF